MAETPDDILRALADPERLAMAGHLARSDATSAELGSALDLPSPRLRKHLNRQLTEEMRRRWLGLICDAADEAELPADPEFRSAFVAYIEWGTRLAVGNSQPGAEPPPKAPVPRWGWGEAPPYQPG